MQCTVHISGWTAIYIIMNFDWRKSTMWICVTKTLRPKLGISLVLSLSKLSAWRNFEFLFILFALLNCVGDAMFCLHYSQGRTHCLTRQCTVYASAQMAVYMCVGNIWKELYSLTKICIVFL